MVGFSKVRTAVKKNGFDANQEFKCAPDVSPSKKWAPEGAR